MGKIFYLLAIALICGGVFAETRIATAPAPFNGSLLVNKSAAGSANIGDTITVTISVMNNGSSAVSARVEEGLGNVQPVAPQPTYADPNPDEYGARTPYLSWALDIPAGETKSVSYTIKPLGAGTLNIGPTSVSVPGGKFYSNSLEIDVACSSAPGCDEKIGETPLTCPQKCGGNANATPPSPDFTLKVIDTPVISGPDPNAAHAAANETATPAPAQEGGIPIIAIVAAAILVIAAAGAYFLFVRKKK